MWCDPAYPHHSMKYNSGYNAFIILTFPAIVIGIKRNTKITKYLCLTTEIFEKKL